MPNLDLNSPTPFVAVMIAVGWLTKGTSKQPETLFKDPLLLCVLFFWLLGFWFQVLWLDWAFPGGVLWMALRLEPFLARMGERSPVTRGQATAFLCLSLGLLVTVDQAGRWSNSGKGELQKATGESREWYPQPGGILYARDGQAFTFGYFLNPDAPWRYMVGFDPTLMKPRDRAIFGNLMAKPKSMQAILPWVADMKSEDRLCIQGGNPNPGDLGLEWHRESSNLWLGRLPRK
jgi:hypothetical protein